MATLRDRPYAQFNFVVDLGTGSSESPQAGFQECGEIGMSVDVVEYRNGNEKESGVRKLTGLARYPDVTLKRGIIGSLDLYSWLDDIRNGNETAYRTVTVQLMNEDHTEVVAGSGSCCARGSSGTERPARRAAQRRGDGGAHARVRAARDGVGGARLVVEPGRRGLVHRGGLLLELRQLPLDVVDQQVRHVVAEAALDHDAQHRQVLAVLREGVRREQPAALAQRVRDVEDREVVDPVAPA